jgi:translation initiation factor 2B subunit (eIF-2B alpha/beta/delta family)
VTARPFGPSEPLPPAVRHALDVFSDPHPPGAVERARWAGRAVVELARAWPPDQPGLPDAVDRLVETVRTIGQSTAHQPQIPNYLRFVIGAGIPDDPVAAARQLGERAAEGEAMTQRAIDRCAELGAGLLADGDAIVVTDFSPSSSHAIMVRAARDGKHLRVYVPACYTRRSNGFRAATEAREMGHEAVITTDAGTGWVLTRGGVRAAFMGADAFLPDGSLLTTNGALAVASIANHLGIEVYGVYDLWKLLPAWTPELTVLNDLEDPDAVPDAPRWAAAGFRYLNPLVDLVPGSLLTACITDAGIVAPGDVAGLAEQRYGALMGAGADAMTSTAAAAGTG